MQEIKIEEVTGWVKEINNIPLQRADYPNFLKPFHLVTLGLTAKQNQWNNLILPPEIKSYAVRMKLWESVDMKPPYKVREYSADGKFLPVQSFKEGKRDVQGVVEQLGKIILQTTSKEYQSSLDSCLEEIVNNFFDHADVYHGLPCLIAAQSWSAGGLVQVAIADAGIGIRASLSQNKELKDELAESNACEIASRYGVSSKPNNGHSGYGLTLAKGLMKQAGGTYILFSGNELFLCQNDRPASKNNINCEWNGTLLVLEWDIKKQLNTKLVYDSWPGIEGLNPDDFFD